MAVVTRSVIAAGGGDYTSIALANAAAEHATTINGGDIYQIEVQDGSNYDAALIVTAGTPTATAYTWITTAVANRFTTPAYDTGSARIDYSGGDTAAIQLNTDFARVSNMQIFRSNAGSSDEGIRVDTADSTIVERCIIWNDDGANNTDGVYYVGNCGNGVVHNCLIYGMGRASVHAQSSTVSVEVAYNTLILGGRNTGSDQYGMLASSFNAATTIVAFNNIICENASGVETVEISRTGGGGTFDLSGSHNGVTADTATYIAGLTTDTATNWVEGVDQVTSTAPATAGYYIADDAIATLDATLVDHANNAALAAGTDRVGSEPDTRVDYSTDILGNARGATIDIGCFQFTAGTGGATVPVPTAFEVDTALAITPGPGAVSVPVPTAGEIDTGGVITPTVGAAAVPVGLAPEVDTAAVITPTPQPVTVPVGTAFEVDTGQPVAAQAGAVTGAVGTALEVDTGQIITPATGATAVPVPTAVEADTGQQITPGPGSVSVPVPTAAEIDTGDLITPIAAGSVLVGTALEIDTGGTVTPAAGPVIVVVATAAEVDAALAILPSTPPVSVPVPTAGEIDTGGSIAPVVAGVVVVATAFEVDAAGIMTPGPGSVTLNVATAFEVDVAGGITPDTTVNVLVGTANEVDAALGIAATPGPVTVVIVTADELDAGLDVAALIAELASAHFQSRATHTMFTGSNFPTITFTSRR